MSTSHKSALHFIVLLANSFLCFGLFFLYDSMVSLQTVLIGVPCKSLNASAVLEGCCESCLGYNPLEYNILVGLPLAVSTVSGIISGFIVDRYGYCILSFVCGLLVVVGAVLRAFGARSNLSHSTSFALMLTGSMIIDNVFTILYIIQLYVCARWFSGKYLSFVIGVTMSINVLGTVLAFYVNPVLVENIGLENTLWCAVSVGASTLVAAILLWLTERQSNCEGYDKVEQTQQSTLSIAVLKEFSSRFWLVSCIIATSWLVFNAFMCNSTAYQTDIYSLHYKTASFSSGVAYITKIIFSPVAGMVASSFDVHGPVALVGCGCYLSGIAMLVTATGPPIIIIVLMGLGFAFVYTVMAAVLTELVPFDKLASANGVMNSLLTLAIGIGDISIGVIAQRQPVRVIGWLQSAVFLLAVTILVTVITLTLSVVDFRSPDRVMCCKCDGERDR